MGNAHHAELDTSRKGGWAGPVLVRLNDLVGQQENR